MPYAAQLGSRETARSQACGPTERRRLLRLAFQLCHNRTTAEDLVQQALENVYRHWRAHGPAEHLEAYARRSVLNEFLRQGRRAAATEVVTDRLPDRISDDGIDSVVERDPLWRALGELPRLQRAALVLRYYEDCPDDEIARLLNRRQATVRSLVARGAARLRVVLDEGPERSPTEVTR